MEFYVQVQVNSCGLLQSHCYDLIRGYDYDAGAGVLPNEHEQDGATNIPEKTGGSTPREI